MTTVTDPFATGSVVAATLAAEAVFDFDPVLRRLLAGPQFFVKQADGRWRPKGCQLGLARCFDFCDLLQPVSREAA
ncbi:hypothetical protein HHL11_01940 [Ramlibacter sp. G-1-2-2]|uniref:Uncharacterized protein n=1 Tax=Ramlibacter agri TaxID=2728837 RepID=A0A848GYW7_9BURK|nr:hypothetical protein [Ramlibacter agri]NML42492.1 hypothetical protein [Ramlibacter agri]